MRVIPQKLKNARYNSGLSQRELGELTGLSTNTVGSIERGTRFPRMASVVRLAKVLNVSVKYLTDENCDDPTERTDEDNYIAMAKEKRILNPEESKIDEIKTSAVNLFAGGRIADKEKDEFFRALTDAYIKSKSK